MLGVRHRVVNDALQKDLEYAACLLVDETADALDTATTCQTTNRRLGDALDIVAHHPVTFWTTTAQTLAQPFATLAASRHGRG
jgi:hypothetical protein